MYIHIAFVQDIFGARRPLGGLLMRQAPRRQRPGLGSGSRSHLTEDIAAK